MIVHDTIHPRDEVGDLLAHVLEVVLVLFEILVVSKSTEEVISSIFFRIIPKYEDKLDIVGWDAV